MQQAGSEIIRAAANRHQNINSEKPMQQAGSEIIRAAANRHQNINAEKPMQGPIADHILVLPEEAPQEIGGLAVPETQSERPTRGVVRAVGRGKITEQGIRIPPEVAVGDRILFPDYAGGHVKYIFDAGDGQDRPYIILRQDEVLFNLGPAKTES